MELGLLFVLSPYQNIYPPTFVRAKKISSPSDVHHGPLPPGQLLAFLCGTHFDPTGQPFGKEGNDNVVILRKNDPATVRIDPYNHLERLLGGLDEVGYLRLTDDLAGALEQAKSSVFDGHTLL